MSERHLFLRAAIGGLIVAFASAAAAAPHTFTVTINQLKFGPVPQTLHKGDAIIWENRDMLRHSATANDGSFNVDLPPGAKAKIVLTKSGAIPFVCRYHPGMRGVLRVS